MIIDLAERLQERQDNLALETLHDHHFATLS